MIRPVPFLALSAVLVALVWFLSSRLPPTDPFAGFGAISALRLDRLSGQTLAKLKLNHARRHGRYDIGLFGNSRSLNVSKADIGIDGCTFFNFSIGSESLRSSAAFLELLAAADRAPHIALVSVDHFELQMYNNPLFPSATQRWRLLARDLWAGVRGRDITLRETAKMAWRHAIIEFLLFKQNFEIDFAMSGVKNLLGVSENHSGHAGGDAFYRADGSRSPSSATLKRQPEGLLSSGSPQVLFGYMKYDLERLKRLRDRGVNVVLFESFVNPDSARFFAENPSSYAAATRARFLSLCREFSLRCQVAPADIPFAAMQWVDHSHPPAKSTGTHLKKLLADDTRHCARDF